MTPTRVPRRGEFVSALAAPLAVPLAVGLQIAIVDGVSPYATFRCAALAILGAVVLVILLGVLLRDVHRGAIGALLVYVLVFSLRSPPLLAVWCGLVLVAVLWDRLPARRFSWARVNAAVSTFVGILLVVIVVGGLSTGKLAAAVSDLSQGGDLPAADDSALVHPTYPDIYVLVMDGYGRADTLKDTFGLDDGGFVRALAQRGLALSETSHSNYPVTAQTLASMLNMSYLDGIPALSGMNSGDPAFEGTFRGAMNDNAAFAMLRERGCQIVTTGSGWEQLALRKSDVYLDDGQLNTFEWAALHETGLSAVVEALDSSWAGDQSRSRIDSAFRQIAQVATTPTPKPRLVLAHLMSPHSPLVFGPNGEPLPVGLDELFAFDWKAAAQDKQAIHDYLGQVQYINGRVEKAMDEILVAARRPTVVIVMSDHGSRLTTPADSQVMAPEADRNFFAALTPGHEGLFGQSPTPVNLFRTLSNAYFGTSMPLLPDRSYVSAWGSPLQLIQLTPEQY